MCLQIMCEEGSDFFLNRMSYIDDGEKATLSHCSFYLHVLYLNIDIFTRLYIDSIINTLNKHYNLKISRYL